DAWLDPSSVMTGQVPQLPAGNAWSTFSWRWIAVAAVVLMLVAGGVVYKTMFMGPPVKHKPVNMLIADFANTTGDPVFDGTIEPMLSIAMEGASFITSYNRGEAHRISGQLNNGDTKMDQGRAQLVAARQGINVVVGGSI